MVEVTFSDAMKMLSVAPLDDAIHDGSKVLQKRAEHWIRQFVAALQPAKLVSLIARVPAEGGPDGQVQANEVRRCVAGAELYLALLQELFCPDAGDAAVAATLSAEIPPSAVDADDFDIYAVASLKYQASAFATLDLATRDFVFSFSAKNLVKPIVNLCTLSTPWLLASGIQGLTLEVRPQVSPNSKRARLLDDLGESLKSEPPKLDEMDKALTRLLQEAGI